MKKTWFPILVIALFLAMTVPGCASKPSDEEMKQLESLKAEVASLEKETAAREAEKAALQKAIADKDAQLAQCVKDKEQAQQRLKGM